MEAGPILDGQPEKKRRKRLTGVVKTLASADGGNSTGIMR
jgi:hypothetical protein